MAIKTLSKSLLVVSLFSLIGCASTDTESDSYTANRMKSPTAQEAARVLGCSHDEVAICIEVNCEIEEFQCAAREDVKRMFKAGEYRYE